MRPWRVISHCARKNGAAAPALSAFFARRRNFFTGVISPSLGKFSAVTRFYSAAFVPRDKYTLWLFSGTDGNVHLIDGIRGRVACLVPLRAVL